MGCEYIEVSVKTDSGIDSLITRVIEKAIVLEDAILAQDPSEQSNSLSF